MQLRERIWEETRGSKARQQAYREICQNDLLFYVSVFLWTYRPQDYGKARLVPFIPYDYQCREGDGMFYHIQSAIRNQHDLALKKAREVGATEASLATFNHEWLFTPESAFGTSSKREDDVINADEPSSHFARFDRFTSRLPSWLKPRVKKREGTRTNLDNGSVLSGESTTPDMFRQKRQTAILFDECAVVENGVAIVGHTGNVTKCRLFVGTVQTGVNALSHVLGLTG